MPRIVVAMVIDLDPALCGAQAAYRDAFSLGGQLADREGRSDECDHYVWPRIPDTTLKNSFDNSSSSGQKWSKVVPLTGTTFDLLTPDLSTGQLCLHTLMHKCTKMGNLERTPLLKVPWHAKK